MNYLAHLFLSQPTPASRVGNLMGDFAKGIDIHDLPDDVRLGLENHRLVDRFTDQHPEVVRLKRLFSDQRRRFAGIMLDLIFDHLLIKHWHRYSEDPFSDEVKRYYADLQAAEALMHPQMLNVISRVISHDWLQGYQTLDGTGYALDRIAGRIRFPNKFSGSGTELEEHYSEIEEGFLHFFPQLMTQVASSGLESFSDRPK